MRTVLWLVFIFSLGFGLPGLCQQPGPVEVKYEYGTQNTEIMDLFRLQGTDYYRFEFSADTFRDKLFEISYAEYIEGSCPGEKMLMNSRDTAALMTLLQDESEFKFRVIAQKMTPESVKFLFIFLDRMGKDQMFPVIDGNPPYSLRTPLKAHVHGENEESFKGDRIAVGEKIPFLVYSLPYKDPAGGYKYCQLTGEDIPPEKWNEHYGVKHYIIFYLKIRTNETASPK